VLRSTHARTTNRQWTDCRDDGSFEIVAVTIAGAPAIATRVARSAEQFVHLGFEIGLHQFSDLGPAQLIELSRKVARGVGNRCRFRVNSIQGVAPSGVSNRRLRRLYFISPEDRHKLQRVRQLDHARDLCAKQSARSYAAAGSKERVDSPF